MLAATVTAGQPDRPVWRRPQREIASQVMQPAQGTASASGSSLVLATITTGEAERGLQSGAQDWLQPAGHGFDRGRKTARSTSQPCAPRSWPACRSW